MSCNSSFSVPNLPDLPNQPTDCSFPRREFGRITYRSFQGQWFKQWKWLHYDSVRDVAYCHYCVSALCDALDLTQCLKDFTLGSDHRTDLFGRFRKLIK